GGVVKISLTCIDNAAESYGGGAISARRHQQILLVFIKAICLREIPDGAGGLIGGSAADDGGAGVRVAVFVGPLREVAFEIEHAEGAGALGEGVYVCEWPHAAAVIGWGECFRIHFVSPGIKPGVG